MRKDRSDVIDDRFKELDEGNLINDGDIRKRLEKVTRIHHCDITGGHNGVTYGDIDYLMNKIYNIKIQKNDGNGWIGRGREGIACDPQPSPNHKIKPNLKKGTILNLNVGGRMLKKKVKSQVCQEMRETCSLWDEVRSYLLDTGASGTFCWSDVSPYLNDAKPSNSKIQVANHSYIKGQETGWLSMYVLNMTQDKSIRNVSVLNEKVTTLSKRDLATELLSMTNLYRVKKYSLILRQPEEGISEMYRPASLGHLEARIPLVFDPNSKGWRLFYIPTKYIKQSHIELLEARIKDKYDESMSIDEEAFKKSLVDQDLIDEVIQYVTSYKEDGVYMIRHNHEEHRNKACHVNVKGVKQQLRRGRNKMTYREFHERYGHIGHCPGCVVCIMAAGCMRRIYSKVAAYKETRPGYLWTMDIIVVSTRSSKGNAYIIVLRCVATGVFKLIPLYKRSHAADRIREWIRDMRANPLYSSMPGGYKVVSNIRTDSAGEWEMENEEWTEMAKVMEFTTIWTSPDRKEEAATAEVSNRVIEVMMRAIMYQNSIPVSRWEWALDSTEFLLNRFPNSNSDDGEPIPYDGDVALPLEKLTRGGKSRAELRKQLESFVMAGTPCLIHRPKVKGSDIKESKARWGIAISMYDNQVIFYCPYTKVTFRSKSFTEFVLKVGVSYIEFLGLPPEPRTQASKVMLGLFRGEHEKVGLDLDGDQSMDALARRGSLRVQVRDSKGIELVTNRETGDIEYKSLDDELRGIRKGPLVVTGPADRRRIVEEEDSSDSSEQEEEEIEGDRTRGGERVMTRASVERERERDREGVECEPKPNPNPEPNPLQNPKMTYKAQRKEPIEIDSWENVEDEIVVDLSTDPSIQREWLETIERDKVKHRMVITGINDRFVNICKIQHKIPFELIEKYRTWLIEQRGIDEKVLDMDRRVVLPKGIELEYPSGARWRELVQDNKTKPEARWERLNQGTAAKAFQEVSEEVRMQAHRVDIKEMLEGIKRARAKKKRSKAVGAGQEDPPKNFVEAWGHTERGEQWIASADTEMKGLTDMGVVVHDYTIEQLREVGIVGDPINMSIDLSHKYNEMGQVDRLKTRMALAGHKGNLQQGVHYDLTYAATPQPNTSRILVALCVLLAWYRVAFDIKMAYCWAHLENNKFMGVKYPPGYERYHPVTGEPLYMLLLKNLYGHPQASRLWSRHRDKFIMEYFNNAERGYTCHRCIMDPCLFHITRPNPVNKDIQDKALMLIHTDDCDIISSSQEFGNYIKDVCHKEWEVKEINADFILGVKREMKRDKDGHLTCTMTMTAFIEGMVESFKSYLPDKIVSTPFPEGQVIINDKSTGEEEANEVLEMGYMRACGMVLWAQRHVYPECAFGISQCCMVMARPTKKAWGYLMHIIAYMNANKNVGLVFSSKGNMAPIAYSDASNKADPTTGKSQYGYVIMMAGGPIVFVSRKLHHVGHNAFHNEYMAMSEASKAIVWVRQLLVEIDMMSLISEPTILYGDNSTAVDLTYENFVSTGNQYIYLAYHFIKEIVKLGHVDTREKRTNYNIADVCTKAVNGATIKRLVPVLRGLVLLDNEGNLPGEMPTPNKHKRGGHTTADLPWKVQGHNNS